MPELRDPLKIFDEIEEASDAMLEMDIIYSPLFKKLIDAYINHEKARLDYYEIDDLIGWLLKLLKKSLKNKKLECNEKNFLERYMKAYQAYREGEHGKSRQILGWTTGKRKPRVNKQMFFLEYLFLIHGGFDFDTSQPVPPVPKEKALEILQKRHGLASREATLQMLKRSLKEQKYSPAGILPNNWPKV